MSKRVIIAVCALCLTGMAARAHVRARTPVRIPDIPGYKTLKCDFHIHTVFSDGSVWPDVRSEEAWREGLDAIAITDHIEYLPHREDIPPNHNRPFQIARPRGDSLSVTVIRGSEITRAMPPGHLNAIFLQDAAALDVEDWRTALQVAREQDAFIFWNHPGWDGQQPDGVARWYAEHDEILAQGRLHGIEIINGREYYPEAHQWALDKNLTLLSNSDIHMPLNLDYDVHDGDHRPLTLVFAANAGAEAIHDALFDRRTAVYSGTQLIGDARFLEPIFQLSIEILHQPASLHGNGTRNLQVHNHSEIPFHMELATPATEITTPAELTLPPGRTVLLPVKARSDLSAGPHSARPAYRITNLLVAPNTPLETTIPLDIVYTPNTN
jgi:3',5'-nucleoside bisphosphate phosphatase